MKWFIRNNRLVIYGSYVFVAIALILAILNDFYTTFVAVFCAAFLLLLTIILNIVQNKALKNAKEILDNRCDPSEYLEVAGGLYKSNTKLPARIVNYCNALLYSDLSNFKIVRDALEQIERSHTAITSKYVEAQFYVTLCDVMIFYKEYHNAEIYYKRAYQAYEGISKEEQIDEIRDRLLIALVQILVYKGDLDRAQRECESIEDKSKRLKLEKLYLNAIISLAKGENENARAYLETVSNSANKLSLSDKADQLLNQDKE